MALYLAETTFDNGVSSRELFEEKVKIIRESLGQRKLRLVEVQVSADYRRAFFIVEGEQEENVKEALEAANTPASLIKQVRLVGQELEEAGRDEETNYVVEWNLPADLTMDKYLERKKRNSVHYAEVPEVKFARTYVCEDMSKCLCFYNAPDEDAVKRAREAVSTPIDSITEVAARSGKSGNRSEP
ncbi:DUF4242 domain-containing protein [Paenibacillus senegalensis]|uniref:DUF4242 domain-containing protein n=1 Tax=Paenibacillus senegalensis TaxID=1465766 RepID=UPI000289ECCD|nr:DUF4242 domain-containing protein [Paenibacillus senegalensis]